jgi:hypothetical protein
MIERGSRSRLALKSLTRGGVGQIRQQLDGDRTLQFRIERR